MPRYEVNWDEVKDKTSFESLEVGTMEAVIQTRGEAEAPNTLSGYQAFWLTFLLDQSDGKKFPLRRKYPMGGEGQIYTKEVVKACGLPAVGRGIFDSNSLHGIKVRVHITKKWDEEKGRWDVNVTAVMPLAKPIESASGSPVEDVLKSILDGN